MLFLRKNKNRIISLISSIFLFIFLTTNIVTATETFKNNQSGTNENYYGTTVDEINNTVKINNTSPMKFSHLVFVDVNGNDSTGDGTKANPYQTPLRAMQKLWSYSDKTSPSAIIFNDGAYYFQPLFTGSSCNLNNNFNRMNVSFIASNLGRVSLTGSSFELLTSENSSSSYETLKFYGIRFEKSSPNSTTSYMHLDGDPYPNEFYNCVFNSLGLGGLYKYSSSYPHPTLQNCVFINCYESYNSKPITTANVVNCVSNNSYIEPIRVSKTTCLYNAIFDDYYNIISDGWQASGTGLNPDGERADIGVYGGAYAWKSHTNDYVLSIESPPKTYSVNDNLTADLFIQNVKDIAALNVEINYDSSKLKLLSIENRCGLDFVQNKRSNGKIETTLKASSDNYIINQRTLLLKLNFQAINSGTSFVKVNNGSISDELTYVRDLSTNEYGTHKILIK